MTSPLQSTYVPSGGLTVRNTVRPGMWSAVVCCYLDIAPGAQLHKKSVWLLNLLVNKTPPAIVVRLHVRKIGVVILTPETVDIVGV